MPSGTYKVRLDGARLRDASGTPFLPRLDDVVVHVPNEDTLVRVRYDDSTPNDPWTHDVLSTLGFGNPRQIVAADFDQDGFADLVVLLMRYDTNVSLVTELLYLPGLGSGRFGSPHSIPVKIPVLSMKVVDWNGDTLPDILTYGESESIFQVFLGDGQGNFRKAPHTPILGAQNYTVFTFGNFIGKKDLEIAQYEHFAGHTLEIIGRDPFLGYNTVAETVLPEQDAFQDLLPGDFNGDGRLDLVGVGFNGGNLGGRNPLLYFQNTGTGFAAPVTIEPSAEYDAMIAADVNRDGFLDLVGFGHDETGDALTILTIQVLLGNGRGRFAKQSPQLLPRDSFSVSFVKTTSFLTAGDLNNDGSIDLVFFKRDNLVDTKTDTNALWVWHGNGTGGFAPATKKPVSVPGYHDRYPSSVALVDIDKDGFLDVVLGSYTDAKIRMLRNNGQGVLALPLPGPNLGGGFFRPSGSRGTGEVSRDFQLVDLNLDGRLDLVRIGLNVEVFLANGVGIDKDPALTGNALKLRESFPFPGTGDATTPPEWLRVADLNHDRFPDLILGSHGSGGGVGAVAVLLGKGDGTFTLAPGSPFGMRYSSEPGEILISNVEPVDVNRDGHVDLLAHFGYAFPARSLAVFFGDGSGRFFFNKNTIVQAYSPQYYKYRGDILTGDFNFDGKPDIIKPADYPATKIYLGKGNGTFAPGRTIWHMADLEPVALVQGIDVNSDGHLDLVGYEGGGLHMFLGNGAGGYSYDSTLDIHIRVTNVQSGDFNGDGHVDFAVGSSTPTNEITILLGDGTGHFALQRVAVAAPQDPHLAALNRTIGISLQTIPRQRVLEAGTFQVE